MSQRIFRFFKEPKREGIPWEESWKGNDKGLITCWEVGRDIRKKEPELAQRAEEGELPPMGWKGGVENKTIKGEKYGTLYYLAQWQGLRGEDLDIETDEPEFVCTRTGMKVIFTGDLKKYGNA